LPLVLRSPQPIRRPIPKQLRGEGDPALICNEAFLKTKACVLPVLATDAVSTPTVAAKVA
jgi:hypothetical protein